MFRPIATLESGVANTPMTPHVYVSCMVPHKPGEKIAVFQDEIRAEGHALTIYSELDPGVFTIEKSARPTDHQLSEANTWAFEGRKTKIGPSEVSIMTGLLLVPSVVGVGLFGARQAPGSEAEHTFGTVSLMKDNLDDSFLLHIAMPSPAHRELGRLIVCRVTES